MRAGAFTWAAESLAWNMARRATATCGHGALSSLARSTGVSTVRAAFRSPPPRGADSIQIGNGQRCGTPDESTTPGRAAYASTRPKLRRTTGGSDLHTVSLTSRTRLRGRVSTARLVRHANVMGCGSLYVGRKVRGESSMNAKRLKARSPQRPRSRRVRSYWVRLVESIPLTSGRDASDRQEMCGFLAARLRASKRENQT